MTRRPGPERPQELRPVRRGAHAGFGALASFVLPFSVYIYYLCPTIVGGDSGELVTAARILGVPHPPGYPLYTLIAHLFSHLPAGSVAWRVNLLSALLSALTSCLVYLSVLRLTRRASAALAAALGLAFSRYFWHYAEVAEVFALNNLFVAALTYLLILITEAARPRLEPRSALAGTAAPSFWLFSFLFGLALTNHHTNILLAPAALFLLWRSAPGVLTKRRIIVSASLLFLLGLTPYAYCPLAAANAPAIYWDDPVNLSNFARLVSRADYGSVSPFTDEGTLSRFAQIPAFLAGLHDQFTALGLGLAGFGLLGFRRSPYLQGYLLIAWLLSGLLFAIYANADIRQPLQVGVLHRFYIMSAVIFAFWIGLGTDRLLARLESIHALRRLPLALVPALALVTLEFATNLEEADFRNNRVAEAWGHNLLLSLPPNALFFVRGDVASMAVDYLQLVEGQRPDVATLDQAKLTYPWYYAQSKARFPDLELPGLRYDGAQTSNRDLIARNISRRPVCFMDFKENSYAQDFRPVPHGMVHRMVPMAEDPAPARWEAETNHIRSRFRRARAERIYAPTSFEFEIMRLYAEPPFRLGYAFEQGGDFAKAERYYLEALALNPDHYKVLKNLAVLYVYKMARVEEGVRLFGRYLVMNPDDPDAPAIRQVVDQHGPRGRVP